MDIKKKILDTQKLIQLGRYSEASTNCKKLIKKFPNNSYFYNLYGLVLQNSGNINKSIDFFEKAIEIDPKNFASINNLANSFRSMYEYKKSENLYKKILIEDPKNIKTLNNYANLKIEVNNYAEAKKLLLQALKIEPENLTVLFNLSVCCEATGEIDKAKKFSFKILDIDPTNTQAHKFISGVGKYKKEDEHFHKMIDLIKDKKFESFSINDKTNLYFALGKAYEDVGDYENAYNYLQKGNLNIKKNSNHDLNNIKKLFNNIKKLFDSINLEKYSGAKEKEKNIFICGMPRSGTTLIEQIIASHSKVSGAGELQYLEKIITNNFFNGLEINKQRVIEELENEKNIILNKYLDLLSFHNFENDTVTDKAPQNFVWIGFIKIFFPNSKIIHTVRNPKDNCLSLFKNYFPSKSMSWAYNQKDIAEYYILYKEIMDYWKYKFQEFIYDANYERIVTNPEEEVKNILSFCDLDWEAECLNFHKNRKTPVQTVSISQANKPIYKSSVNSNKAYTEYLSEMFQILDTKY